MASHPVSSEFLSPLTPVVGPHWGDITSHIEIHFQVTTPIVPPPANNTLSHLISLLRRKPSLLPHCHFIVPSNANSQLLLLFSLCQHQDFQNNHTTLQIDQLHFTQLTPSSLEPRLLLDSRMPHSLGFYNKFSSVGSSFPPWLMLLDGPGPRLSLLSVYTQSSHDLIESHRFK